MKSTGSCSIRHRHVSEHAERCQTCHRGREFIDCLEGKVTCIIGNQEYNLAPGDSLLFNARVPHRWQNADPGSTRLLVLFCPMESIDQSAERHLG